MHSGIIQTFFTRESGQSYIVRSLKKICSSLPSVVSKATVHFADQKCNTYERSYQAKAACIMYPKLYVPQVRRASALNSELEIYNDVMW